MKKSLNNRLIEAVKKGRINDVKSLLKSGADVNSRDPIFFNDSALMFASKNSRNGSSLDIVKLLVKEGADVNAVNDYGASSLILASGETNDDSSYETVEFLLDSGADVNVRAYGGEYSLSEAALYSNSTSSLKTVKLLLDRGSNSNAIISALNVCQTKSCKILIQESLNDKQKQLCKNLHKEENRDALQGLASIFGIPVVSGMTKSQLCDLIEKRIRRMQLYPRLL